MNNILFSITVLTIVADGFIAVADYLRMPFVLQNSRAVNVPEQWLPILASLKLAGVGGLILGLVGVPFTGIAAGIGLVLFFIGAIVTHLRAGNLALAFPAAFLALNIGALVHALIV